MPQDPAAANAHTPKLVPLGTEHLPILRYILARIERADLYSVSPSYFALTGRKGLWIYGDEKRGMLIARHPNIPDTLLLFPPFGSNGAALIESVLNDPDLPDGAIQIARLGDEDEEIIRYCAKRGFKMEQEKKLDWIYPVHTLNIEAVLSCAGARYSDFRHNLNCAMKLDLRCTLLNTNEHEAAIRDLITVWAKNHKSGFSIEDLISPTHLALHLKRTSSMPVRGLMVFEGERPASFIMWEETRPDRGQAAGLCNASISTAKGVSEYTYFEMCRVLHERGFRQVCIGGSEEAGLDAFKRKMAPEQSTPLRTIIF